MNAKDKHTELSAKMKAIDDDIKGRLTEMRQDVKDSIAPLRSKVDDYWTALLAEADEAWKLGVLNDAKKRIDSMLDKAGTDEDDRLDAVNYALGDIDSALGWVVPRPVDPVVIEAVKKRDRAADMAERAAKGVGIKG